jgi:hypothetical protein
MIRFSSPEVVASYFADGFTPRLAAMQLCWPDPEDVQRTRLWRLPGNVRLLDTVPERFGIRILRHGEDCYEVSLLWNRVSLHEPAVSRAELLRSALGPVLAAVGTDLAHLLEQPVAAPLRRAA